MRTAAILLAGAALGAVAGLAQAQNSVPSTATASPPAPVAPGVPAGPPATPAAKPATPAPAATLTRMDQAFIQHAANAGTAEIQAAQLAEQKASNDQVKQFAKTMLDDHTKANDELTQIAQKKGVALPAASPDADTETKDLRKLSGAAFDRRYAALEVKDHEDAVHLFHDEEHSGGDPDLKRFAGDTLPTLEEQSDDAKKLATAVGEKKAAPHRKHAKSSASRAPTG